MVDVAQYINEVKRDSDHLVIIQKVKVSERFFCYEDLKLKQKRGPKNYKHTNNDPNHYT